MSSPPLRRRRRLQLRWLCDSFLILVLDRINRFSGLLPVETIADLSSPSSQTASSSSSPRAVRAATAADVSLACSTLCHSRADFLSARRLSASSLSFLPSVSSPFPSLISLSLSTHVSRSLVLAPPLSLSRLIQRFPSVPKSPHCVHLQSCANRFSSLSSPSLSNPSVVCSTDLDRHVATTNQFASPLSSQRLASEELQTENTLLTSCSESTTARD